MSGTLPGSVEIGDAVICQELQGETVLLNMHNQSYFSLDDVGTVMWQTLLKYHSLEAAAERLVRIYEANASTINSDLEQLVGKLIAAGLLRAAD